MYFIKICMSKVHLLLFNSITMDTTEVVRDVPYGKSFS